jgi:hypothetical protein
VLDPRAAVAVVAAAAEFGLELLDRVGRDLRRRAGLELWLDVFAQVGAVAVFGGLLDLGGLEVFLDELHQRGVGLGVAVGLDLVNEALLGFFGQLGGVWSGFDDLADVVWLAGQDVRAGVDADSQ